MWPSNDLARTQKENEIQQGYHFLKTSVQRQCSVEQVAETTFHHVFGHFLFSETRNALRNPQLESGHLFHGSAPVTPAPGVLFHKLKRVIFLLRIMFAELALSQKTIGFVAAYAPIVFVPVMFWEIFI